VVSFGNLQLHWKEKGKLLDECNVKNGRALFSSLGEIRLVGHGRLDLKSGVCDEVDIV
jgi:hypothetical protein